MEKIHGGEGASVRQIDPAEISGRIKDYEYGLIYRISDVLLEKTDALLGMDPEEFLEARFFSKEEEMHVFRRNGKLQAVLVDDGAFSDSIDRVYFLGGGFRKTGERLRVRQYLSQDEDGQTYIALTRLAGIERGAYGGK